MSLFVDTSAFFAVLDGSDLHHPKARQIWKNLIESSEDLISTSYVLVETFALVQSRLGMEAVRCFDEDILPVVKVHWISESDHRASVSALLIAGRRQLSLVDCVSFTVMRQLQIRRTFAFDTDFVDQGFETLE